MAASSAATALVAPAAQGSHDAIAISLILLGVLFAVLGLVVEALAWAMVGGLGVPATGVLVGTVGRSGGRVRA